MRFDGRLKSWNDERGFGFIEALQGGQEIFVHIKAFPSGTGRPAVGLPVTFEVELGPQGKKRARAVQFPHLKQRLHAPRAEPPVPWSWPRLLVIPLFLLIYWFVARRWPVSPWVALAYLVASLIAFLAYAIDKSAARHGRWRTREATLHWLSLACGWPGALLAQQLLRHKSSKPAFVSRYWATVIGNIAGFVSLHASVVGRLLV